MSIVPREKVRINNPPQFWVKESICYLNLKFSKFSEFSEVRLPATLYVSHTLIDYCVRELYVTHVCLTYTAIYSRTSHLSETVTHWYL